MYLNIKDKVLVITGANGGIGRATALRSASRGACFVSTDIDGKAARFTAGTIEAEGGINETFDKADTCHASFTKYPSIKDFR